MILAILASASSTSAEKSLMPWLGTLFSPASTAFWTSSSRFLLCSAETSTTGTPSIFEIFLASMTSPREASRSHMLRPTTTGRPASRTCVVR